MRRIGDRALHVGAGNGSTNWPKPMRICLLLLSILCVGVRCTAGPFQDLNFDSANTNTVVDIGGGGFYYGPNSDLIPGWQLLRGSTLDGPIGFNLSLAGTGYTSVFSPSFVNHAPVIGSYSFGMVPEAHGGTFLPFSLSQSGDLPPDVKSIHFLSYGAPLELQVNGSLLSLSYAPIASQSGWNPAIPVFDAVGDISSFAGETVELEFTTLQSPLGYNGLDEIYFSTIAVPEPSTLMLFSLGGLALFARRRRRQ